MMERPVLGVLLMATLQGVVSGLQPGPSYSLFGRPCSRDSQCSRELGEICWWLYNGCGSGQCLCPPSTHIQDKNGRCVPVKLGNEPCQSGDRCPDEMSCTNGTCQCTNGVMHSGEKFCILATQRLLGQACDVNIDSCYHKAIYGFSSQDVRCGDNGQCECLPGFKQEHQTCRRLLIREWGCSQAFHCGGGAICVDGYCQCPNGYKPIASRTKCAKIGALSELPVGRRCDEVNDKRYCAKGLVCHRCFSQSLHTCVRYQFINYGADQQPLSSGYEASPSPKHLSAVLGLLAAYLFRR